jgi:hypothetical protein
MKFSHTYKAVLLLFIFISGIITGCDKEVDGTELLAPLQPASLDEDAASWKMIILNSADQIPVAAPAAVTSDAYQAELTSIKNLQQSLTNAQRNAIDYWSVGGVLRWNQIMRELVARYNLPPAPDDTGYYPVPDPENPFGDPAFPFANPPYAARSYSYVSVGQYEALKAAWYYKYLYQRAAPYANDPDVKALMPAGGLPAYPSEDAVVSGVTAELLKVLFPAAVKQIATLAAEQRNAAIWSGKASPSDVAAGLALGKSVAAAVLSRAASDGMRQAVGTPAQWSALYDSARVHWTKAGFSGATEVLWQSLEIPPRPPMLPFFGQVKGWFLTQQDFAKERPGPPPSTSSEKMVKELEEVKQYSKNFTRQQLAIAHKWADGVGTYTPPGHWNDIAIEHISEAGFSEVRAARAFALVNMALHNAGVACWENKYYWMNPRPSQLDPSIKTLTGIPNFPSYGSGHSTFSASAAAVLAYLFPAHAAYYTAQAQEAAVSRLYGAIHYRTDIDDGLTHGERIASYVINFALQDGAD